MLESWRKQSRDVRMDERRDGGEMERKRSRGREGLKGDRR